LISAKNGSTSHPQNIRPRLLSDKSKRIVVRWSRQAGKTTTLALRAIWFALRHPKTLTLIVAPSLRQSMILADKLQDFLTGLPPSSRKAIIDKLQRTVIRFKNASRIVALPNSPNLLRGYTAHQVICDEAAFFRDDELVFYNVLMPMLSTTDGDAYRFKHALEHGFSLLQNVHEPRIQPACCHVGGRCQSRLS